MQLIKQYFLTSDQTDFSLTGIYKQIERCARVCYKSEDKITETSCFKFVDNLIKSDHSRTLEFGTVHMKFSAEKYNNVKDLLLHAGMWNDMWIKSTKIDDTYYVTTNYRYYLEINNIHMGYALEPIQITSEDNNYYPKRHTVHFVTSRGVMDEFRTHVGLSHLAESTRWCNYSKNKFNNELSFIIPNWCNSLKEGSKQEYSPFEINEDKIEFMNALQNAQNSYLSLLKMGWTAQQARSVLPLEIKAELISCGFEDAWENFFYRRDDKAAHPMARDIASKLHEVFKKNEWVHN